MSARQRSRIKPRSKHSEIEQIAIELDHVAAELAATKDFFAAIIRNLNAESIAETGEALVANQIGRVDQIAERLRALELEMASRAEVGLRSRRCRRSRISAGRDAVALGAASAACSALGVRS